MFIRKERLAILEAEIGRLQEDNERLTKKIENLEKEKQNIKSNLEDEHLENQEQHRQLLKIEKLLKGKFGSYIDLLNFKNKVQSIIKNELADANLTNSNHLNT